eukprot:6320527-Pyramimonas_sp.AAC.1
MGSFESNTLSVPIICGMGMRRGIVMSPDAAQGALTGYARWLLHKTRCKILRRGECVYLLEDLREDI